MLSIEGQGHRSMSVTVYDQYKWTSDQDRVKISVNVGIKSS